MTKPVSTKAGRGQIAGQDLYVAGYEPDPVPDELVAKFERDGYLIIRDAVSPETIDRVREAADRIIAEGNTRGRWEGKPDTAPRRFEYRGIFNLDETFMELLAPPTLFPLIVKIMGANLHMMSSQAIYQKPHQPPMPAVRGGWHRDVIGPSQDLGYDKTPRLAIRAGYFVSDTSEPGSGITLFAPGSHLLKEPIELAPGTDNPEHFIRPDVKPGDAVLWENRTFHAPERNTSDNMRKAVMVQYGFRWVRPADYLTHSRELLDKCDPVARQLLDSTDLNEDGSMTRMKGSKALLDWASEHGLA